MRDQDLQAALSTCAARPRVGHEGGHIEPRLHAFVTEFTEYMYAAKRSSPFLESIARTSCNSMITGLER